MRLWELEIYYLQACHPATHILKFRDAGCGMENLQIINFKLPQPALQDVGFGMRNEIIFAKYNILQLFEKKINYA